MGNFAAWRAYLGPHRRGQYGRALEAYKKAGEFTASAPLAAYGVLLLKAGDFQAAHDAFDRLLRMPLKGGQRSHAIINRALCTWKLGDAEGGLATLEALYKKEKSQVLYGCYGFMLFACGFYDKAEKIALEALDYCEDAVFYDTLGQIKYAQGEYDEALERFEKALYLKEDMAESLYYSALIYIDNKEFDKAKELLQKARNCPFSALMSVDLTMVEKEIKEFPSRGGEFISNAPPQLSQEPRCHW
ncbi:MAG: tetratricopeptide repeat protein [Clostridia bacterium]|nr:tetratricopeptide repeat protein [Clostridia bacterium]